MSRLSFLGALGATVVLGVVGMAAPTPGAGAQEVPSASIDVRVWQNVGDELDIRISARPTGGLWQTVGTIPLPLDDGLSSSGRYRYGDLEMDVAVQTGSLPATVEVRVWQDRGDPRNVYLSARGSYGSWRTLGTIPLALDDGFSRNGGFRYSDIRIDVPLPQPAVTTFSAYGGDRGSLAIAPDGSVIATNLRSDTVERISPDGRVTTIAGRGTGGEPHDGPAEEAVFSQPQGVAIGRDGSIYVGDTRVIDWVTVGFVRKVAPDGTVSTVAGGGDSKWEDSPIPAAEARLSSVGALAVDGHGSIVILGYSAILHLSLAGEGEVRIVAGRRGTGANDGPGREARFGYLAEGAMDIDDAGNIYVLDPLRYSSGLGSFLSRTAVRMIDEREFVSTLFEDPHPGFGGILTTSRGGLAVTGDGAFIYIANTAQNQIVRLTREGQLQAVAGTGERGHADGPCDEALFDRPTALALADDDRTLMVVDQRGAYLRRIDLDQSAACPGNLQLAEPEPPPPKLAGVESRVVARFPSGIRLHHGRFAASSENVLVGVHDGSLSHIVLSRDGHPVIEPIIGGTSGQDGPCETAQLSGPRSVHVAVEADGSIWFSQYVSTGKFRVRRITWTLPEEKVPGLDCQVTTIATVPAHGGGEVALDGQGNLLVSNGGLHRISPDGAVSTVLRDTRELAFAEGTAYVIEVDGEAFALAIKKIDAAGRPSTFWEGPEGRQGGGIVSLQDIALAAAPDGTLYVWSGPDERILRIRKDGSASIMYDVTDDLGGPRAYIDGHPYIGVDGALWVNAWNAVTDSTEIHQFTFPDQVRDLNSNRKE